MNTDIQDTQRYDFFHAHVEMDTTRFLRAAFDLLLSKPTVRSFDLLFGAHRRCPTFLRLYAYQLHDKETLFWPDSDDIHFYNELAARLNVLVRWLVLFESTRICAYIELPYSSCNQAILEPRDYWVSGKLDTWLAGQGKTAQFANGHTFVDAVKHLYVPFDRYWSFDKWHTIKARREGIVSPRTQIREALYCCFSDTKNAVKAVGSATKVTKDLRVAMRRFISNDL